MSHYYFARSVKKSLGDSEMIETEVASILAAEDDGTAINRVADEFRSQRRDVTELLCLLDSEEGEVVWVGAWVLGEVAFELYNSTQFLDRLRGLLKHPRPSVRFTALGALFPAFDGESSATQALLRELHNDPDKGVRLRVRAAAERLGVALESSS